MPRRSAVAGSILAVVVAATGCGGDDEATTPVASTSASETTDTSASESAEPSQEPTATESETGSSEGSTDTYADVAPATGTLLQSEAFTVNVPADWDGPVSDNPPIATGPTPDYTVSLSETTAAASDTPLAAQARSTIRFRQLDQGERLDDVVIAGQPAYHVAGTDSVFETPTDIFGFTTGGRELLVAISTPTDLAQADRDALIGTVLASFQLTGA